MAGFIEILGGPILGFVGGVVSKWQDMEMKKVDNAHELKKFDFELTMRDKERIAKQEENEQNMAMNAQEVEGQLAMTVMKGDTEGLVASINAAANQKSGFPWVEAFNSLVRPVLTLFAMGVMTLLCFDTYKDTQEAARMAMLSNGGTILLWWFGSRGSQVVKSRYFK